MLTAEESKLAWAKERTGISHLPVIGEKAFDDLTDLQNDEFIVSLDLFYIQPLIFLGSTYIEHDERSDMYCTLNDITRLLTILNYL